MAFNFKELKVKLLLKIGCNPINSFSKKLKNGCIEMIQWIYPSLCEHCHVPTKAFGSLFCHSCLDLLTLIPGNGRCKTCFKELEVSGCDVCKKRKKVVFRQVAAVEANGPGKTLLQSLEKGDRKSLKAAASLMAYQWLNEEKTLPDFLIALPIPGFKRLLSDSHPAEELAKALSKILKIPILRGLKARYDHAAFLQGEPMRYAFEVSSKVTSSMIDQHVLLIAPLLEDETLQRAGIALQIAYPLKIDALCFAVRDSH